MRAIAQFQIAMMLLTRLPAGQVRGDAPAMGQTVWAWPLAGAIVGVLSGGAAFMLAHLGVPLMIAGLAGLAVTALATGGLHEDGLADVADGFGGGRDREAKLDIMRDSRVGSYAVLALIFAVALRVAAIAKAPSAADLLIAFIPLAAVSRALMALPLVLLPPARAGGLGASVTVSAGQAVAAMVIAAAASMVCLGAQGLVPVAIMSGAALGMVALARHQIGGQTGDVCGATQVVADTAGWITLAALYATS